MLADGSAVVQSGTQDLGTGTYTVMAQLAADELGLPIERVRLELGDSRFPQAPASGGSQTVASVGPAVVAACREARDHVFAMALSDRAEQWKGVTPAALTLQDGVVKGPQGHIGIAEMLAHRNVEMLEFQAGSAPGAERKTHSMHAFAPNSPKCASIPTPAKSA